MAHVRAAESLEIAAPASVVYDIIADYNNGHPRILPPQYFAGLTVERGGRGAGTRINFQMKAFGKTNVAAADITEPEPGRVLRETLDAGIVTDFIVEAIGTDRSRTTIQTTYETPGFRGFVESFLAPRFLRKVYVAELAMLAQEAVARHTAGRSA